jgi:hypothetical protein
VELTFADLERTFNPRTPGGWLVLEDKRVRVHIESGVKEYLVDIDIEPNPAPEYSSRSEVIGSEIGQ